MLVSYVFMFEFDSQRTGVPATSLSICQYTVTTYSFQFAKKTYNCLCHEWRGRPAPRGSAVKRSY